MKESPIFSASSPKTKSSQNEPKSAKIPTVQTPKTSKEVVEKPAGSPVKQPIIRESKLVLNQKLLERLRKPSHQVEFYQAIQSSMQSEDKIPPKLVQGGSMINPGDFFAQIFCILNVHFARKQRSYTVFRLDSMKI